ncbi:hypothetical protein BX600DRAFT_510749 [Xylariales sp. PMI_506]|nr:hypothetical protein BX600DRAFT_510749 [Xylariales sp. PMI_506]
MPTEDKYFDIKNRRLSMPSADVVSDIVAQHRSAAEAALTGKALAVDIRSENNRGGYNSSSNRNSTYASVGTSTQNTTHRHSWVPKWRASTGGIPETSAGGMTGISGGASSSGKRDSQRGWRHSIRSQHFAMTGATTGVGQGMGWTLFTEVQTYAGPPVDVGQFKGTGASSPTRQGQNYSDSPGAGSRFASQPARKRQSPRTSRFRHSMIDSSSGYEKLGDGLNVDGGRSDRFDSLQLHHNDKSDFPQQIYDIEEINPTGNFDSQYVHDSSDSISHPGARTTLDPVFEESPAKAIVSSPSRTIDVGIGDENDSIDEPILSVAETRRSPSPSPPPYSQSQTLNSAQYTSKSNWRDDGTWPRDSSSRGSTMKFPDKRPRSIWSRMFRWGKFGSRHHAIAL